MLLHKCEVRVRIFYCPTWQNVFFPMFYIPLAFIPKGTPPHKKDAVPGFIGQQCHKFLPRHREIMICENLFFLIRPFLAVSYPAVIEYLFSSPFFMEPEDLYS